MYIIVTPALLHHLFVPVSAYRKNHTRSGSDMFVHQLFVSTRINNHSKHMASSQLHQDT